MNYHLQTTNVINGTSKQGTMTATYEELVGFFGQPELSPGEDHKTHHTWVVMIEGVLCTIYDYKENLNTGREEEWHIGGKVPAAAYLVKAVMRGE